jgi:hypothetical protein
MSDTPATDEKSGFSRAKTDDFSPENKKLLADAWLLATPNGSSTYLAVKGVGAFGTAATPSGALYIPMRDQAGELKNFQRLEAPDANGKTKGPEKSYLIKDQSIDGLQHLIGEIQPNKPLVFTAEYAEAAAIHQATGYPVVVAFTEENIPNALSNYLDQAEKQKLQVVVHFKPTQEETPPDHPYLPMMPIPFVHLLEAGGNKKIDGFDGFSGQTLDQLMLQFGGKAVKALVDEALANSPAVEPKGQEQAQQASDPKVSWTGPWQQSDDGLTAVRQVVGQVSEGSGYLAGHQKMVRGVEAKPQWEDELFPKFPEAELRSKLLAIRAQEADAAKPAPVVEPGTIEKVKSDNEPLASDVDDVLLKLKSQYLLAENKFYFRDNTKTVAFADAGKTVTTDHESPEIIRSMLELTTTKGWSEVKLNGTDTFKRRAWLEAELLGIKTQGYTPDDFDRNELAQRQATALADAPQKNSISQATNPAVETAPQNTATPNAEPTADPSASETNELAARYGTRLAKDLQRALARKGYAADSEDAHLAIDYVAGLATSPRVFVGKLIEHGPAPYEFKEKGTPNYFVRLETPYGEKTVWGVDIPRALSEVKGSNITSGDEVILAFQGSKPATVHNEATGEVIHTHRNSWYAEKVDSLPSVARDATEKPTYTRDPAPPAPSNRDAKQQMLAGVLQKKGAPPDAINKALSATAAIPKPARAPAPAPTAAKPTV